MRNGNLLISGIISLLAFGPIRIILTGRPAKSNINHPPHNRKLHANLL